MDALQGETETKITQVAGRKLVLSSSSDRVFPVQVCKIPICSAFPWIPRRFILCWRLEPNIYLEGRSKMQVALSGERERERKKKTRRLF